MNGAAATPCMSPTTTTSGAYPVHDDRRLFEMLILEGAQAGLSWLTILRKREQYRRAFDGFDVERVAAYSEDEVQRLLADPGIVRNRLKIEAAIRNARGILEHTGSHSVLLIRLSGAMSITPPGRMPGNPWPNCRPGPNFRIG